METKARWRYRATIRGRLRSDRAIPVERDDLLIEVVAPTSDEARALASARVRAVFPEAIEAKVCLEPVDHRWRLSA